MKRIIILVLLVCVLLVSCGGIVYLHEEKFTPMLVVGIEKDGDWHKISINKEGILEETHLTVYYETDPGFKVGDILEFKKVEE